MPVDDGLVKFWALNGPVTYWAFDGRRGRSSTGRVHTIAGTCWDASSARLAVDDARATDMPAVGSTATPAGLDRIDVGFSESSSGALEGLVTGLQIGAM